MKIVMRVKDPGVIMVSFHSQLWVNQLTCMNQDSETVQLVLGYWVRAPTSPDREKKQFLEEAADKNLKAEGGGSLEQDSKTIRN